MLTEPQVLAYLNTTLEYPGYPGYHYRAAPFSDENYYNWKIARPAGLPEILGHVCGHGRQYTIFTNTTSEDLIKFLEGEINMGYDELGCCRTRVS